jgi:succinate dehydrogenase / fumarate reductase membrane anchor subunit
MQSAIGRMRARGSARSGVGHWKAQRVTAIINLVLVLWFVVQVVGMAGAGHAEWTAWFQSQVNASLMVVLVLSTFYHVRLGVQVAIEDYVHHEGIKVASLLALTLACAVLAASCVVSILMLVTGA